MENFQHDFPAIWCVFAGTYLNHENAPHEIVESHESEKLATKKIDQREKILVDLLRNYLTKELDNAATSQPFEEDIRAKLAVVRQLLDLWSEDLNIIYEIRKSVLGKSPFEDKVKQLAERFFQRVKAFQNCTVLPNGLVYAGRTGGYECVNLAVLKKDDARIDWIQVNPGGLYHQSHKSTAGDKSNAYFEISDIDFDNITEDWFYLLVGLKAVTLEKDFYYKEVSLYECLLAHLNGKTEFQSNSDDGFVFYSHSSPHHTWQVIEFSFRYLLQHFLGEVFLDVHNRLITGFKLFLMKKTFLAYPGVTGVLKEQCHFLLLEMCQHMAQHALSYGDEVQKSLSLQHINDAKGAIEQYCSQVRNKISFSFKLNELCVFSLSFVAPKQVVHTDSSSSSIERNLQIEPTFVQPGINILIIDYLKHLKCNFIDKLIDSNQLNDIVALSCGIETFFLEYFVKTDILQESKNPFSRDDTYLGNMLKDLAEVYYSCQGKISSFLSNETYQPQFYAKNVTIQFFIYAAIAALNLRHKNIGPLLKQYNLSTEIGYYLSLNKIIPHLVILDPRYLKVLLAVKDIFVPNKNKQTLFSCYRDEIEFRITNESQINDTDISFAYELLQKDPQAFEKFKYAYRNLEEEKFNRKWQSLTYSDSFLPELYCLLSKIAYFAKTSLTGFPDSTINNVKSTMSWANFYQRYWCSLTSFRINNCYVYTKPCSKKLTSYLIKPNSYERDPYEYLIVERENIGSQESKIHFLENEVIASQNKKPSKMEGVRYIHLGSLQSEPWLKLERLYIAIKEQQLNFSCEQECLLIKQTLFETSMLLETGKGLCSLLEWTAQNNPLLVHKLGMLCIEKALSMKYRLTQHTAIFEILEVLLSLLNFYPPKFKDEFVENITVIYYLIKNILMEPPAHLNDKTLLNLNAYLIISIRAKPQLIKTETLTLLKSYLTIQNYKVEGLNLENNRLLYIYLTNFTCGELFQNVLVQNPNLLDEVILSINPQWKSGNLWKKDKTGLMFTSNGYAVKPLHGMIYFQNKPVTGLPDEITQHTVFEDYFGKANFAVIPASRKMNTNKETACYLSVDHEPRVRLTLIKNDLLIEEWIENEYQLFHPAKQLLGHSNYPQLLFTLPNSTKKLTHWSNNARKILVKNLQREILYEWDLQTNTIASSEHQGYVVPWEQLQESHFKTWLKKIDLPKWIEIIAEDVAGINIKSLHFPRLGLHFDYKHKKFLSKQIHSYIISEQQNINTLHGFLNYIVLENKEKYSTQNVIKLIIPHRKITPHGSFYKKTTKANLHEIKQPPYFVYDFDSKTDLLKTNSISAFLYLALLYYCSASLDDDDASHCNAYHLSRENLEKCWKDQPYDEVELDIIQQLIDEKTLRDYHCYRIALYLKVVSLLQSSLHLSFLYTDESSVKNTERSQQLLKKCCEKFPNFLTLYLQNKGNIAQRIKLNTEEEQDMRKIFEIVSCCNKKPYNKYYGLLFNKQLLNNTSFLRIFEEHIRVLQFVCDMKELNFSSGIKGIMLDRFRLVHFITLYNLAKSSKIPVKMFCYLLHHTVLRASIDIKKFPIELVTMLARAILLVAEHPSQFPKSPSWFESSYLSIDLFKRNITQYEVLNAFPSFVWRSQKEYKTYEEERREKEKARQENEAENNCIWSHFKSYDLNYQNVPLDLPDNPNNFCLKYESHVRFNDNTKRTTIRKLYLEAARNDAMYKFFVSLLQMCDHLKHASKMGWAISEFIQKDISFESVELPSLTIPEPINLEKKVITLKQVIDLTQFFTVNQQPLKNCNFPFEKELQEPDGEQDGYQQKFLSELKDSWAAYHRETSLVYFWKNDQSLEELENYLHVKVTDINEQAEQKWNCIAKLLETRPNSKPDNYFALRWHSGQALHYHNADLVTLLIEPCKLAYFNPACLKEQHILYEDLLYYVTFKINAAKLIRALSLIQQYKQIANESEKFSLLNCLVKNLQEDIDPLSYDYPHWLLFQFENNLIIRDNQRELTVDMLNQTEKAMYQLNMGEGKSSVILPLLSYNLANGKQLLRINVLSSLAATMKNFLRHCFSGLVKRHIYTLPFYRNTDISTENLTMILETLKICQVQGHILLVTPEHRMCLQLKVRELMLENQQQKNATDVFNWETYRQRAQCKVDIYNDLTEEKTKQLLAEQDQSLKKCLFDQKYIDQHNKILKVPPRGQGRKKFAQFKKTINNPMFREWSCLKAAYRELLFNSTRGHVDSSEKLLLLNKISSVQAIDLLDESDEILRHGTELNYTMGDKYVFAGEEFRWQIPQFFLQLVFCDSTIKKIIGAGKAEGFTDINQHYSPRGGVPLIQLLSELYYEKNIKPLLVEKFLVEYLPSFRKYGISPDDSVVKGEESSLRSYIAGRLSLSTEKKIVSFLQDKVQLKDKVLTAKGWLTHGILFHVLNSKYRVQFGLHIDLNGLLQKPIAIPFWGKDTPSLRSEFGHPDVMLGFTIISYLYHGLNQQQMKETLIRLKNKYNHQVADMHLRDWAESSRSWIETQTDSFPPILLKSFEHIDLEDEQCLAQVHHYLSGNHSVIFFYLNQYVFLQEAMQYRTKISANAHSLVGFDPALGFSGTDDRKITMPFEIESLRSTTQQGTNGKLLSVLTEERNSSYCSIQINSTEHLLKQVCDYVEKQPLCHALIDAGALVTGLTNYEVATFLLANLPDLFLGILYFSDEKNNLTVLTRDRKILTLQDCFLDKQYLFAYLDDVHTRGTDIKLPLNCHAVLTVGMGIEKDKLMQAAMRLRQLAEKQSVTLWGTQVVSFAIARDNCIDVTEINSCEVIKWVTHNTIEHINADLFPVAVRKINFQFLKKAMSWMKEAPVPLNTLIKHCEEKEPFLLEEFYAVTPQKEDLADRLFWLVSTKLKTFWYELEQELESKQLVSTTFYKKILSKANKYAFRDCLDKICKEVAIYLQTGYVHTSLDNDEEKEVEVEIIQEQESVVQVEMKEANEEKEWDPRLILKKNFIELAEEKNIIMSLNFIKKFIQLPANLRNIIWNPDIYMTQNYIASVKLNANEKVDNYLRPTDVVLIHRLMDKSTAVLLSGQEAARIKNAYHYDLANNLLVHLNDMDGPTQLPIGHKINKKEHKLFTIIKLFAGECSYYSEYEVKWLSLRLGRIYSSYFTNPDANINTQASEKLFELLIKKGYLDFAGIMTDKLLHVLDRKKDGESPALPLETEYKQYETYLLEKLFGIYKKLIIKPMSLKESYNVVWQWIGTRGRMKDYTGSKLESIINPECQLKY